MLVIAVASVTDVSRRRIPNLLTLPAIGFGLLVGGSTSGWLGLGMALLGAVLAPCVLMVLRLGHPLGMGDVKLAAAIGSLTGPVVGSIAMLLAAVAGGLLAIIWMFRPGTSVARSIAPFLSGVPILGKAYASPPVGEALGPVTIPYGVAIGAGSLVALVAVWMR
jgi:prepilin peptidase CpaA